MVLFYLLLYVLNIILMFVFHIDRTFSAMIDSVLIAVAMTFLFLLLFNVVYGETIYEEQDRKFALFVVLDYLSCFTASCVYAVNGLPQYSHMNFISMSLSVIFSILSCMAFWFYVGDYFALGKMKNRFSVTVTVYMSLYILGILSNFLSKKFFFVDADGFMAYTPYSALGSIWCALLYMHYFICILRSKLNKRIKYSLATYSMFPMFALLIAWLFEAKRLDFNYLPFFPICDVLSYYLIFFNVFQTRSRQIVEKERQLAEMKLNAMQLQINPHFIYNTLGSIESLCVTDPAQAQTLVRDFSDYLRGGYAEMVNETMVSIEKEIETVQSYLAVERVRFPNIKVEYNLRSKNFYLPGLSVQPLVENAVMHGICKRRKSVGKIVIETYETPDAFHVCIRDDGVGFETEQANDGRQHIGLQNVRGRLSLLCGGGLTVSSVPDKGTVAEINIPKEEQE